MSLLAVQDFNHYSSVRHVDGPHTGLPRIPKDLKSDTRSLNTSPPSYAGTKRSADESEDEDARPAVRRKKVRVGASESKLTMKLRSRSSSRALSPLVRTDRSAEEAAHEDPRPALGAKRPADEAANKDSHSILGSKRSADDSEDEDPRPAVRRKKVRLGASENKLTMKLRSRSSSRALSPSPASMKRSADGTVEEDPRPTLRRRRLRNRIST